MATHRRRPVEVPHRPFYKDERIFGRAITVSVSLRLLLISLIIFACVVGWALFTIIDSNNQVRQTIINGRADRLANQALTEQKITELACLVVRDFPDDSAAIVKQLREKYNCPPFKAPTGAPTSPAPESLTGS